jgi:TRAP-type C4-dicarboxylate transport system permease small subunit
VGSYHRLDQAVARVEGAIAVVVLLSMVLVASAQALSFNIAERGVAWAQWLLESLSWADSFLQKGTLWLAFLGASLATYQDKHIAINVLPKLASPRARALMCVFASFASGVIALILARVFYQACVVADAAVPFAYEVLTSDGPAHVCDAADGDLGRTARPEVFCALRSGLAALGVPVSSGEGIAQLIAPLMLVLIGARLLARSVIVALALFRGPGGGDDPEFEVPRKSESP